MSKKNEMGLSLIEASMVLALAAVVVAGVMFYYQSASDNNKTQTAISEVMSASGYLSTVYGTATDDFTGADAVLAKSNALPPSANPHKDGTGKYAFVNPWGGAFNVRNINGEYPLLIEMYNVPDSACVQLASVKYSNTIKGVLVNSKYIDAKSKVDEVSAACADKSGEPAKDQVNHVGWYLGS